MNDIETQRRVMQTALRTAHPRSISRIEHSFEIFQSACKLASDHHLAIDDSLLNYKLAIEIEARGRGIDTILQKIASTQILELGAGLSPRGLKFSDRCDVYREIDYPGMTDLKKAVYHALGETNARLQCCALDLGNMGAGQDDPAELMDGWTQAPVTVVSEGLFWYLSWEQKEALSLGIKKLLDRQGGVWITSDCPPIEGDPLGFSSSAARREISETAMSAIAENKFHSVSHFDKYFSDLGFSVEVINLADLVEETQSEKYLRVSRRESRDRISTYASIAILKSASGVA